MQLRVPARSFEVSSGGPGRDDRVEMMGEDYRVEREREDLISCLEIRLKHTWYTLLS